MQANGVKVDSNILVSPDITGNMLVSCNDLVRLQVIPEGFPNQRIQWCQRTCEFKDLLIKEFGSTLSDDLNPEPMKSEKPMHVSLKPGAVPTKVTVARRVPLRYEAEANKTITDLVKRGVIAPVRETTEWCSPAFFVPKGDNIRVRLVTDYTALNKHVNRPVHLFQHTKEILQAIPPEANFFCKLDAVHGYFQLGMDEYSSKLTTFLLPQGKFRYLRAPMGLNASSDEWCCHSDVIIQGLPWARKIVDDTLIWAETEEELLDRTRIVLQRCKENNITISLKKLEMGSEIEFAGHIISPKGIRPDENKYAAIQQFPTPRNITDLRAFLGLAQQLASFIPDLAHMTSPLRPLLKKGNAWLWLDEHEQEFRKIKSLLISKSVVHPFNPDKETILLTDASRLHGLGFALLQMQDGNVNYSLIQCGSCSLTETQERYATVELECLAIQWAVNKCEFYLRGLPDFKILTDHRPLVGLFKKSLHQLENARLMRMREKLTNNTFHVEWVEGKNHLIADALSRAPVFTAEEFAMQADTAIHCLQAKSSESLADIGLKRDEDYLQMLAAVRSGKDFASLPPCHAARKYKNISDQISIASLDGSDIAMLDGSRIIVPQPAQRKVLQELHRSHAGHTKTLKTARQLYFWPGMKNDIIHEIDNCKVCREDLPTQARPTCTSTPASTAQAPMQHVASDLFDSQGHTWLVLVDRYSGYAWTSKLRSTTTSSVTTILSGWFDDYGWPTSIRTDGGPQYRTEFSDFCSNYGIKHELSSAYNPESNGLAESAVKSMKSLVSRCSRAGQPLHQAIAAWRNMAREDGYSPAQLFFGRRQRQRLPCTPSHCLLETPHMEARDELAKQQTAARNERTKDYTQLQLGDRAWLQNPVSGKWDTQVEIDSVRPEGHSYTCLLYTSPSPRDKRQSRMPSSA